MNLALYWLKTMCSCRVELSWQQDSWRRWVLKKAVVVGHSAGAVTAVELYRRSARP